MLYCGFEDPYSWHKLRRAEERIRAAPLSDRRAYFRAWWKEYHRLDRRSTRGAEQDSRLADLRDRLLPLVLPLL